MKKSTPIQTVMTTDVDTVHLGQQLSAAAELLRDKGYRHLPVVDGRRPVGMLSATDIFKLVYDHGGTDERMAAAMLDHGHSIATAMTIDLHTLSDSSTVHDAAEALSAGTFSSVIVVDDAGNLAGLVTAVDLIRFLRDQF